LIRNETIKNFELDNSVTEGNSSSSSEYNIWKQSDEKESVPSLNKAEEEEKESATN